MAGFIDPDTVQATGKAFVDPDIVQATGQRFIDPDNTPSAPSPSFLRKAADVALGTVETPLSLATGILAYPISKVGGAGMSVYQGLAGNPNPGQEAQKFEDFIRQTYTYQPSSQSGQQATNFVGKLASLPFYPSQKIGEKVTEAGYPNLGYNLQTAGEYATMMLTPLARKGTEGIAARIAESQLPERIYGSAVKTPLSKKWVQQLPGEEVNQRTKVLQEGVKERVPPSDFGIQKAKRLEAEAKTAVDKVLQDAVNRGDETIKTQDMLDAGLKSAYDVAANSSDPVGARAAVDAYAEKFIEGHGEEMSVQKANAVKRQLYNETKWTGNDPTGLTAQLNEVTKKGTAHAIMAELEKRYPELDALNQSDAARIGLIEALERSQARYGNTNLLPLGAKILTGRSIPMALIDATIGHPQIKARLAFALAKGRSIAQMARKSPSGSETFTPEPTGSLYPDTYNEPGPYGPVVPYPSSANFTPWSTTPRELETANMQMMRQGQQFTPQASLPESIRTYREQGAPIAGPPKRNLQTPGRIEVGTGSTPSEAGLNISREPIPEGLNISAEELLNLLEQMYRGGR